MYKALFIKIGVIKISPPYLIKRATYYYGFIYLKLVYVGRGE